MEQNETVSAPETTQGSEPDLETRRRRLVFRARHRGTFETDILIGGFVDRNVHKMDAAALTDMEAVLEMPDPDLSDWLFGRLPLPQERETPMLVAMIKDCRTQRGEN